MTGINEWVDDVVAGRDESLGPKINDGGFLMRKMVPRVRAGRGRRARYENYLNIRWNRTVERALRGKATFSV